MTVGDIYSLIDSFAPFDAQEEWDNSGLLVGDKSREVKKIMLCLDITKAAVYEAVSEGASLVISHHPVIFDPLYTLSPEHPAVILANHGISAICAHTNFDFAKGGMNDRLCDMLFGGLKPDGAIEDKTGLGRTVTLKEAISARELCEHIKNVLLCKEVRYTQTDSSIKKIGVITGSGGGYIKEAMEKGCDALITGDVKHDAFITAANLGFCLIDAGHFYTENIFCKALEEKLLGLAADVFISKESRDVTTTLK